MATLTSANSVLMLGVKNLFNIPVKIEGFATDDMFSIADADTAEIVMGCDGKLSAGFTPTPRVLEITLQADSASNDFFDALITAEATAREKYELSGTMLLSGTNRLYAMTRGFMGKISPMPGAKKTLQSRKYEITFQSISVAPV